MTQTNTIEMQATNTKTMQALRITKPNQPEMIKIPVPTPKENEVLIKVMASGICGTDIHILHGQYMGDYPVIPGHEFAGIVEQVGSNVKRIKTGDRVAVEPNIACDNCSYCLNNKQNFCENWDAVGVTLPGGMEQYVCAPEKAVFNIGDLPFEEGAFVEPLSCVLHGIQKANIKLADRIAIIGAGPIGLLLLQAVKVQGSSQVTVVETDPTRGLAAKEEGASAVLSSLDQLAEDGYEIVIDATGIPAIMQQLTKYTRKGGTILLFGVPPMDKNIELPAFTLFVKGLTVLSSFTSVRNSIQAINLLKSKAIDVSRLISHKLPLEEFEKGVNLILNKEDNVKKVMIIPNN